MALPTSSQQRMPGNLALCSRTSSTPSCLGWADTSTTTTLSGEAAVTKPLSPTTDPLNWRFENGLLRAVGTDGLTTDFCLGPKTTTSLDTNAFQPYELELQDCPGADDELHAENIFAHDTISLEKRLRRQDESTSNPDSNPETPNEQDSLQRHMRFLMGTDGRMRSLAPVYDPTSTTPGKDLVVEQPFCMTVGDAGSDDSFAKVYLVPCFQNQDETHVYNDSSAETPSHRIFKGQQQLFEPDARTSFDSFLLNWKDQQDQDETDTLQAQATTNSQDIQLAYQIGYYGPLADSHDEAFDQFDSFAIRMTRQGKLQDHSPAVFETILPKQQQSGVGSYPSSSFGPGHSTMSASLLGRSSTGSVPTELLASTSFQVTNNATATDGIFAATTPFSSFSEQPQVPPPPPPQETELVRLPWAHFFFWGFMVGFAILVKINSMMQAKLEEPRPRRSVLRDSMMTVDTNAADVSSVDSREEDEHPSPTKVQITHHQKRNNRRSRRRSSSTRGVLPLELYDWDESSHGRDISSKSAGSFCLSPSGSSKSGRTYCLSPSSSRSSPSQRSRSNRSRVVRINTTGQLDTTQTTIASESSSLDDTLKSNLLLELANSDIEDDDLFDDDQLSDSENHTDDDDDDDDDIEAQA